MAEVVLTQDARDQVAGLPRTVQARDAKLLERVAQWPEVSGAKPLTGNLAGRFRMRTGDYRVQFRLEAETVVMERIGHRDGFYDD